MATVDSCKLFPVKRKGGLACSGGKLRITENGDRSYTEGQIMPVSFARKSR